MIIQFCSSYITTTEIILCDTCHVIFTEFIQVLPNILTPSVEIVGFLGLKNCVQEIGFFSLKMGIKDFSHSLVNINHLLYIKRVQMHASFHFVTSVGCAKLGIS